MVFSVLRENVGRRIKTRRGLYVGVHAGGFVVTEKSFLYPLLRPFYAMLYRVLLQQSQGYGPFSDPAPYVGYSPEAGAEQTLAPAAAAGFPHEKQLLRLERYLPKQCREDIAALINKYAKEGRRLQDGDAPAIIEEYLRNKKIDEILDFNDKEYQNTLMRRIVVRNKRKHNMRSSHAYEESV